MIFTPWTACPLLPAFQVKGEIALSQGNPQQARRDFEAAEHELTVLQPGPAGATSSSDYE